MRGFLLWASDSRHGVTASRIAATRGVCLSVKGIFMCGYGALEAVYDIDLSLALGVL